MDLLFSSWTTGGAGSDSISVKAPSKAEFAPFEYGITRCSMFGCRRHRSRWRKLRSHHVAVTDHLVQYRLAEEDA